MPVTLYVSVRVCVLLQCVSAAAGGACARKAAGTVAREASGAGRARPPRRPPPACSVYCSRRVTVYSCNNPTPRSPIGKYIGLIYV